jgi:hypothetical protein
MRIIFLLLFGALLVGCDHPVHEAGLPVNGPASALAHP